ncbi:ADP-ribosylation factor 1-like [Protopterus annectens]|uniref:ADP-ribosylation factor 1-like n=1 Tax=Protopterus annectens TaxID=7888 RepID=UPI001CFB0B05|nr:ADP-ribosylation factor 1-like [Protopterus annectens]
MGILLSRIYESLMGFNGMKARILMLGLDAAGKTTVLYKLKLNEAITTIPTIGFNVETVEPMRNVSFTVWDVGGQTKIRALWKHYFMNTDGLVFVLDSADPERFNEAREELEAILDDDQMQGVPFVILANKQDLPGARRPSELVDALCLRKLHGHEWHVQGCCAVNGDGLVEGLHRLSELVKQNKK